ncbi:MAG: YlxR family protein [Deinococcales bacterium]
MKNPRTPHKQFDASGKRIPIRTCAVCRARLPQRQVLRLGRDATGLLQPDPKRRMAGRGVYICQSANCRSLKPLGRVARADAMRLAATLEAHFMSVTTLETL